jgi:hypothetical protein
MPFATAVSAGDLNGDGVSELFVGTYRLELDQLWKFQRSTQSNIAARVGIDGVRAPAGNKGGGHALGASMADFDNDGDLDLIVSNLMHPDWRGYLGSNESMLFENLGALKFRARKLRELGVDYEETPANVLFEDFDNDGHLDLLHNSMYHSANLYVWRGGKRADRTASAGLSAKQSLAVAACDFDHDGRVDLAVADKGRGLVVYRNVSPQKAWVGIRLRGVHCNRDAAGAIARIRVGKRILTRSVSLGRGMACQDSASLVFGLGSFKGQANAEITWPCGTRQTTGPLRRNSYSLVVERSKPRYTTGSMGEGKHAPG